MTTCAFKAGVLATDRMMDYHCGHVTKVRKIGQYTVAGAGSLPLMTRIWNALEKGTDIPAIRAVREATSRPLIAAGGITTQAEIDELDALGIDAVVGMAIYTGHLKLESRN